MNWLKSKKIVLTHDSNFHADDVFSVATLSILLGGRIKIIRTRDITKFDKADYIVDVGLVYNPSLKRFDHHLVSGIDYRPNGVPYAAFGLLWKEYGEKICGSKEAANIVEKKLVQGVDAVDNNFSLEEEKISGIRPYSISEYIFSMNRASKVDERNKIFLKLVDFAKSLLMMEIRLAQELVVGINSIRHAYEVATDKRIIILDKNYSGLEVLSEYPEPLFSIKPASDSDIWKIHTIKDNRSKDRLPLPVAWGGKDRNELIKTTGISEAIYSDHRLFMATAKTKEAAIKMVQLAIDLNNNK